MSFVGRTCRAIQETPRTRDHNKRKSCTRKVKLACGVSEGGGDRDRSLAQPEHWILLLLSERAPEAELCAPNIECNR